MGVCSYLLVSFWFTRIAANQSSISAFLTNRVGDCFLTIGMFAILWSLGKEQIFKLLYIISRVNQYTDISFIYNQKCKNIRSISSSKIRTHKLSRYASSGQIRQYSSLGPYLAGLIEGDGHIAVQDVNTQKVVHRPKIIIAFNIHDKPLAEKLSTKLNVGKVIDRSESGHVLLQILAKEEVLKIINLINGHMRTPKLEALHRAINWINKKDNSSIPCLGLDTSPLNSNAWLAGFSDADGCFSITTSNYRKSERIITNFKLKGNLCFYNYQPQHKENLFQYFELFSQISEFFKTKLISRVKYVSVGKIFSFYIICSNFNSFNVIINYFSAYPMLGKKYWDFLNWHEAVTSSKLKKNPKNSLETFNLSHKMPVSLVKFNNIFDSNFTRYSINNSNKLSFSTLANGSVESKTFEVKDILEYLNKHPTWVTGYVDAEGNFTILTHKSDRSKIGYEIKVVFQIFIHKKDENILKAIQLFFGAGRIYYSKDAVGIKVQSVKDLEKIITHFDNYPLISKKWLNYQLFKQAFELVKQKQHLSKEGLNKIMSIKASMNLGLSTELEEEFTNIQPVKLPVGLKQNITDPQWVAGFTTGDGCFFIQIRSRKANEGYVIQLGLTISQHIKDEVLMRNLIEYLNCGNVYKYSNALNYRVQSFVDIEEKIIPFFAKNLILGIKSLDYLDWCKAASIIINKQHLTKEGLERINSLKKGMNTLR